MKILIFSSLITVIDQISKILVRSNINQQQKLNIINDYFYLTFVKNEGAAFGILQGQRLFFIAATFFFLAFLFYFYKKELPHNLFTKTAIIFLTGGSLANFFDRILFHYVTDFIAVDIIPFYQFPVINIADIFISSGVIILIYEILFHNSKNN